MRPTRRQEARAEVGAEVERLARDAYYAGECDGCPACDPPEPYEPVLALPWATLAEVAA